MKRTLSCLLLLMSVHSYAQGAKIPAMTCEKITRIGNPCGTEKIDSIKMSVGDLEKIPEVPLRQVRPVQIQIDLAPACYYSGESISVSGMLPEMTFNKFSKEQVVLPVIREFNTFWNFSSSAFVDFPEQMSSQKPFKVDITLVNNFVNAQGGIELSTRSFQTECELD